MKNPFERRELKEPSFFRRIFGRPLPDNGYIELGNILAGEDWAKLHEGHTSAALLRHGVIAADREKLRSIFRKAVVHFVQDLQFDAGEIRRLDELKNILGLSRRDLDTVTREVALEAYTGEVDKAAADRQLTEGEKEHLAAVAASLGLDTRDAIERIRQKGSAILQAEWDAALADGRLSPDEEQSLAAMARDFGVEVDGGAASRELASRYRLLWLIENGQPPVYESPVALQRNELCHFTVPAERYEVRTQTKRYNYGGPTVRIKIMKGVYYRAGSIHVAPVKEEVVKHVDSGTLIITSKRLIFRGSSSNTTVRLSNLLAFTPYSDGVEIEKNSGRNMIFKLSDPELLGVLLGALLAEQ
jgi:hypothetical protein